VNGWSLNTEGVLQIPTSIDAMDHDRLRQDLIDLKLSPSEVDEVPEVLPIVTDAD
jgi:hypothetical protein